jgi:transposase
MLRISSPKDLLPFRPQEDLLPYEEGLRKAVCESKTASRTYRCATGALLDPSCCVPMTAFDAVDGSSTGTGVPWKWALLSASTIRRSQVMQATTTIGLDIAKSVFQVHGIDAEGNVTLRRRVKRRYVLAFFQKLPPCLVGIEACASSHHWSRELQALGHTVRLMPPAYVKPHVKRHKNDAVDAEAICEAVTRANMRFVATKTPEQQSCLTLHRTRHLFIRQQTSVINAIRAHLAEFGIVAPVGRHGVEQLLGVVADADDRRLPDVARSCVAALGAQLRTLKAQILQFDRMIRAWHRSSEASRRLDDIPGVGPALATALVASVADPKVFRSGRDFSAWIGLVPKQNSSGGKDRLGNISKRGDRYLRSLFTTGALAVIRYAKIHGAKHRPWLTALLTRRPTKVAAIALANKIARIAWAIMAKGERYKEPAALAA